MYYLIYFVALLSLSQASIIIRWSQTDPLILGSWRLLIAAFIIRIFFYLTQKNKKQSIHLTKKQWRDLIITGFLFFLHLYTYAYAAHITPIAHLMLIFSCNPIITSLGNLLFFKEKVTKYHLFAFFFAFLGIYFLVINKNYENNTSGLGDLLSMIAAITFSAYSLLSKHIRKQLPNSVATSSFYLVASLFFFATTFLSAKSPIPTGNHAWIAIGLLALFPTILGHSSYTFCMNFIDIQILSIGKLAEPILSTFAAHWLFAEPITHQHIISFLFITFGISIIIFKPKF